jgi:hypothetical protein
MLSKLSLIITALFISISIAYAQEIPMDQLDDFQDVDVTTPDDLSGVELPNETGTQLFSYAKWLFSPNSAREILGETLAPLAVDIFSYLGILISLAIIWAGIKVAVLAIKFLLFIADWIRKIIELIPFIQ